ncbi:MULTISPECIES: immune inhibitor A domain-containing protein [unclassified Nocardioides]|uniref:immune inhibitor A domain-containing protein n=1 Tax=unclassified Nocardioides TaxID=2615069 RepID=UPI0002E59EE7|nr:MULTISPECIES: immune inhibitor A domain-containing protein [unclassified Nocardioides]
MRRTRVAATATASLIAAATALSLTTTPQAGATPPAADRATKADRGTPSDVLTPGWKTKYHERTQAALEKRLRTGGKGQAEKLGKGVYGRVAQTGKDRIFVVLAEFGDRRHQAYQDDPDSGAQRYDGPLHNQIPKPNRKKDNSTLWNADFSRSYFQNMYFNRMRDFFEDQSSGQYSIDGDVTAWVKVPFNEARYGSNKDCGYIVCGNVNFLIRDALSEWVQGRLDAGWTMARIQDYLKTFDVQDRYDFDGDGDFREPDGYLDHFQIVHAGGDEADGDPVYGSDAIWSHRGNAALHGLGEGPGPAIGGIQVGEGGKSDGSAPDGGVVFPDNPTGLWVSDYTMQPENGGLSVFAHEYTHDLELPDLYDTSGNTGGASNSVEHWSLMAQSRGTAKRDAGIGDRPQPMGAWEKFQLGWLDYDTINAGHSGTFRLRPGASTTGSQANGLIVLLPDKDVTFQYGEPCAECGERFYFSGSGDNLDQTMTRTVEGGGELTAKVRYDIEPGWDYAFLEVSSDGGETWTSIPTSESYTEPDQGSFNPDGTGISGTTDGAWVDLTATVPDGTNAVRWRYLTDGAAAYPGFQVDNITLAGASIGTAETDDEGWVMDGFEAVHSEETRAFLNTYFVDNRQYVGRDRVLAHVYNFAGFEKRPDWVDFFAYQPGALISYWDTSYADNNVGDHPGHGEVLPVDARPTFQHAFDGSILRPKVLTADSTFSRRPSPSQKLHYRGHAYTLKSQSAVPLFDDTLDWWFGGDEHGSGDHPGFYEPEWYSVDVPKTGTTIRVVKVNSRTGVMTVRVGTSS